MLSNDPKTVNAGVEKLNTGPNIPKQTTMLIPEADMTPVEQPMETVEGEANPLGPTPLDGQPLTIDQLSLVTESVWQRIGHHLDAKHS